MKEVYHMFNQALFDSYVARALELRAIWARAGVDFFQYLVEWEADESRWKGALGARTGYETFSEMLHATNIVKPHRLDKFKSVVARFGLEQVRTIGLEAAEELNKIPENVPSRREPSVPAATAAMRDACQFPARNHTTPSTMTARSIAREHYEPPPKEKEEAPSFDDRVKELEHENAQLKKALAAKDREIATRDRKIAKLERDLAAAQTVAVPRARRGRAAPAQPSA